MYNNNPTAINDGLEDDKDVTAMEEEDLRR